MTDEDAYWEPESIEFGEDPRMYLRTHEEGVMSTIRSKGRKEDLLKNPTYRFYIYVDAIARRLVDEGEVGFALEKLEGLLKSIDEFKNPEYKNPTAFIFGFDLTYESFFRRIDATAFADRVEYLRRSDDANVKNVDLVRYARLWMNVKGGA